MIVRFARLVARVEDAGPGVMKVLGPLGMRPSEYVKLRAEWEAWAASEPAHRAELDRELAAARLEDLRAPLELIEVAEAGPGERAIEVPTYLMAGKKL